MKLRLIAAAAVLAAGTAQAAPASVAIGMVNVLGTDYSVSLLYDDSGSTSAQSFNALMPSITFTTQADAMAAAEALRDTFGAGYDWNPAQSFDGARVAYSFDATMYQYMTVSACCGGTNVYGPFDAGRDDGNFFSFAQFSVVAVPEPQTYALMALGLVAMGAMVRRRRQA